MVSIFSGVLKPVWMCMILVVGGVFSNHPCTEDHECYENEFCYDMRICAACYNCTSYYRKPHPWKVCAKKPTDCGNCLSGYKVDIFTNGEEREYCVAVPKENFLQSGGAQSSGSLMPLLICVGVTIPIVIIGLFLVHHWRKTRFRSGDQSAQGIQNQSHASFGNGSSPLLGAPHERKTLIEERTAYERPSAPSLPCEVPSEPPPLYKGHTPPVIETLPAPVDAKLCRDSNPENLFPRMLSDDYPEDDQLSEGGSDLNSDGFFEAAVTWAYLNDDTVGVSDMLDANSQPSDVPISTNTDGPSFLGILANNISSYNIETNAATNSVVSQASNNHETHEETDSVVSRLSNNSETCRGSDSGLSHASSSISITSDEEEVVNEYNRPAIKRQRLECGCYSRSEIQGDYSCRSENCPLRRTIHTIGQTRDSLALDAEVLTNFDGSNDQTVSNQANDSGVSQASSSKSIYLSSVELQDETDIPVNKRQKLNSDISIRLENFEGSEDLISPEAPVNNSHIIVINEPNDL